MVPELIRDLVHELDKADISNDVLHILKFQKESLELSAKIGKKSINYSEIYDKAKRLGFSENLISVLIDSASSILHDWDDYLFAGHTGHSSVFIPKHFGKEDKTLKAVFIGNEIGGRIGILSVVGPLNGQMMTHIHGIISATITEYLIGEINKIPQRVSYYMSNPNFISFDGFMGGKTKIFSSVFPIACGILTSIFELGENLSAENGFFKMFSYSDWKKNLGKVFSPSFFLTRTLMIKKFPACAYVIPQIECALSLREKIEKEKGEFSPEKIESIQIDYSIINYILDQIAVKYIDSELQKNIIPLEFFTPFVFAIALVENKFGPESYLKFDKTNVMRVYGKIKTKHNSDFSRKVIKNVLEHFPFITPPNLNGFIYAIGNFAKDKKVSISPSVLFDMAKISFTSPQKYLKPDGFRFIFPTRVKIIYDGKKLEEEREYHMFLARETSEKEMRDFLEFKKSFI